MTLGQRVLVLLGGIGIIGALGALMRSRRLADRKTVPVMGADPQALESEAPSADPLAAGAAAADARTEAPEQSSARLRALQEMQGLAFGTPITAASAPAALADESLESIRATLASIADRPNYAPRRPLLLPKLMRAMNDDEVSRRELGRIIATDPALAGGLLRLANSPFYRIQPEAVESLDRAIALLGLEGMRSLVAAALLQPVFRIGGGIFQHFGEVTWEHTLHSAAAAEAHAAVLENSDPFAAQLLALIMGLATIVVFRVATDEFLLHQGRPNAAVLAALLDAETSPVARRIAGSWELSERIDTALGEQQSAAVPASPLGRSLQIGRFLGALALLHAHGLMTDEDVQAALKSCGTLAGTYGRIWARLRTLPAS